MLHDLLLANRSYRSFDPSVKISHERLANFVDSARLCPSSRNWQMLKFRLVETDAECKELLKNLRFAGLLKDVKLPPEGHEPTSYIVICADKNILPSADTFDKDVGICALAILLSAVEEGFGGCMVGSFDANAVRKLLNLSENLIPKLVLALGRPDETVELTDSDGTSIDYYRENGIHYVPKRSVKDLIV